MDFSKLDEIVISYKEDFPNNIKDEIYKWEAIKIFQDNWNINAENFSDMLNKSLSGAENLLTSSYYYAKGMIVAMAEKDPERVKSMFMNLFDESLPLENRYKLFTDSSKELLLKYWDSSKHDYQDSHSISVYLSFRYPEKYYIYKASVQRNNAKVLNYNIKDSNKAKELSNFFDMCNLVKDHISQDTELKKMLSNSINENSYKDESYHVLTMDLLFYMGTYYLKKNNNTNRNERKIWIYAPGENAKYWDDCINNSAILLGWDEIDDLKKYTSREDIANKLNEANGEIKSRMNDSLALYEFANEMKIDDLVIVKQGRSILLGYGKITSDYYYDENRNTYRHTRKVEWIRTGYWDLRDYNEHNVVMKTLTDLTKYEGYPERLIDLMNGKIEKNNNSYLLPCNPNMYKIFDAVPELKTITWKQVFANISIGETVYIYVSDPESRICFKGHIKEVNTQNRIDDSNYVIDDTYYGNYEKYMTVEFDEEDYDLTDYDGLDIRSLKQHGIKSVQGSQKLTNETIYYINSIINDNNEIKTEKINTYSKKNFLEEVYFDEEEYNIITELLDRKKNIILQGAPGVGKTYMANRLAWSIIGETKSANIVNIQFHQSYSYEDFIEGYRPNDKGFLLEEGIFYTLCQKAADNPNEKFFCIIDEINRGNLSKIFGELLMLIESDKRGKEHYLKLPYSKVDFYIPENIYIIGMMNTADRSLAMMDYALRRRFAFYTIKPAYDNSKFNEYIDNFDNEFLNTTIDNIKQLNIDISNDTSLGEGFEIGHSYFCNLNGGSDTEIESIIKFEIIPMIKEYWFDEPNKVKEWEDRLLGE